MARKVYIDNIPLDEALEKFMQELEKCSYFKIEEEEIDTIEAQGRILSQAVFARLSAPHYPAAAMDGIAVKAVSTFGATENNPVMLQPGKDYIEVDTGDYVPRNFDAVIMIEEVNFIDGQAQIIKPAVPWQHIRSIGEDITAGDMICPAFTEIGPEEIGSLLTAAVNKVKVVKRPLVAIIPTGTELVNYGGYNMAPGEIIESNSQVLGNLCKKWGADYIRRPIVPDDKDQLLQAIENIKDQADMIVICSGSSAGKEDYTAEVVNKAGKLLVHGIAIRPGKPAILGIIDNKPVIGVPGYPVSAHLIFNIFAKPVIYKKQRRTPPPENIVTCKISRKLSSPMGVDEFIHVNVARIKENYIAYPLSKGAGVTTTLVKSDGILHIPRGSEGLEAGSPCNIILKTPLSRIDKTLISIGSHDIALDILRDELNKKYNLRLISNHTGSMGGIMSLMRGETHFSGIHLLDPQTGEYNKSYLKKYLPRQKWILIHLAKRIQGLIVKKGNPLNIKKLADLTNPEIRFVNRQKGSGTRILLDYLLQKENIHPDMINGYNHEEYTHLSVAAAIKGDACDAGLGIYASAKIMGLDFIPIAEENYDLCILTDIVDEKYLHFILSIIKDEEFVQKLTFIGGYDLTESGKMIDQN
ncbi:molybdopterin molybdochelatase [Thermosyntropha lipolytica DSM 11003]|uniref:Molybdopterin molybdenumtransferase n=1 Tax=Thermosyntropha lipolytica DSM 11003 TaxID=1123382 RepID=A0A1M5RV36_9FIRM|nr:molybdopterin biosynthesis protein [Thermosyntropha lipolytica]SHH29693.1 molybdopterin molybdochelatase [Thermosyntropha lipolytica DSM 11003]